MYFSTRPLTEKVSAELRLPAGVARAGVPAPPGPRRLDVRDAVRERAAVALGAKIIRLVGYSIYSQFNLIGRLSSRLFLTLEQTPFL